MADSGHSSNFPFRMFMQHKGRVSTDKRCLGIDLRFALRAWMRGVVNLREMLEIQVGVDLGRRNVGVAEQFLHAAQIAGGSST